MMFALCYHENSNIDAIHKVTKHPDTHAAQFAEELRVFQRAFLCWQKPIG